ncbi:MAG: hypothetical protein JWN28_977 [Candidatus Saccharibacteria bacterium]|nr:hypothetical protein [Candidatus Saccharibacteria bacterium]
MAHQIESQPTRTTSGQSTPESIQEHEMSHQQVAYILDSMVNEYIQVLYNPQTSYKYDSGYKTPGHAEKDDEGKVTYEAGQTIYNSFAKEDIIEAKLNDLNLFIKGSMRNGSLAFDVSQLPKEGILSIDSLIDTASEIYLTDSIARATERLQHPAHISTEGTDADSESTSKFIDVLKGIKEFGAAAIQAIENGPLQFSRPNNIITAFNTQQEIIQEATELPAADDRELLNDPEHFPEVTQFIDLGKVKY